jgi:hypothetical protein
MFSERGKTVPSFLYVFWRGIYRASVEMPIADTRYCSLSTGFMNNFSFFIKDTICGALKPAMMSELICEYDQKMQ